MNPADWIPGLFSLFGAFVGAGLARQTNYQQWLLQEKSREFCEFIRQLQAAQASCADLLHCQTEEELIVDIRISELFLGLRVQQNIVRIYLSDKHRSDLAKCMEDVWALGSRVLTQSARLTLAQRSTEAIQDILECSLRANYSFKPNLLRRSA